PLLWSIETSSPDPPVHDGALGPPPSPLRSGTRLHTIPPREILGFRGEPGISRPGISHPTKIFDCAETPSLHSSVPHLSNARLPFRGARPRSGAPGHPPPAANRWIRAK